MADNGKTAEPFIRAVRAALNQMLKPRAPIESGGRPHTHGSGIMDFSFAPLSADGKELVLPTDADVPYDNDVSLYITKEMEYVESFLLTHRLALDIKKRDKTAHVQGLIPRSFRPERFIEVILHVIGRGLGEERALDELKYYPYPYFASVTDVPFIDFAGLLVKVLTDFVRYKGVDDNSAMVKAARAEIETAVEFLIHEDTIIEQDGQLGWSFVPRVRCDQIRGGAAANRHILPTAWALFALSRHNLMQNANEELKERCREILPRVMGWFQLLRTEDGLYKPNETVGSPSLANHNYATEAVLSLVELGFDPGGDIAVEAITRFVNELDRGESELAACDLNVSHRVATNDSPFTTYPDRTTIANFLATLATATGYLEDLGDDYAELVATTRGVSTKLAQHLLQDRRDESSGLWQRGQIQFHWVLSAVEGLLRYARFGRADFFETSSDAVVQAIDSFLRDPDFAKFFRQHLLEAIKRMSQLELKAE